MNNKELLSKITENNYQIGTEAYNIITGPVEFFRTFVNKVLEEDSIRDQNLNSQRQNALNQIYSTLHNPEVSSQERVEIIKIIKGIQVSQVLFFIKN